MITPWYSSQRASWGRIRTNYYTTRLVLVFGGEGAPAVVAFPVSL